MRIARRVIWAALTAAAALGAFSGPAAAQGLHITLAKSA